MRFVAIKSFVFFFALCFFTTAFAKKDDFKNYRVAYSDGVPWKFRETDRTVVVGDVHGDVSALAAILRNAQLVDQDGHWKGGRTRLVMMGDMVGKGDDSRLVLDWVMSLEKEAERSGGHVHALLGNHEYYLVSNDFDRMTLEDQERFVFNYDAGDLDDMFDKGSKYGRWLAKKNAIIQIGKMQFSHAGPRGWLRKFNPGQINATVRKWFCYELGRCEEPRGSTKWVIGKSSQKNDIPKEDGPLFNHTFSLHDDKNSESDNPEAQLKNKTLKKIAKQYGVTSFFIGHNPVSIKAAMVKNPNFKFPVHMTDSAISRAMGGRPSYFDIKKGEAEPKITFVDRPKEEHAVRARLINRLLKASGSCTDLFE